MALGRVVLHQVAAEVLGDDTPMAVLSGPTFAKEVGDGLPTAMTVAANEAAFARALAASLSGDNFRAYTSDDMIGVEVGGAVKVLAVPDDARRRRRRWRDQGLPLEITHEIIVDGA